MSDFMFLMHNDLTAPEDEAAWGLWLGSLRAAGVFQGGSGMGGGVALRKAGTPGALSSHISGFIRIEADDLEHATRLLAGIPVYEAGGTVEIRELPRDD